MAVVILGLHLLVVVEARAVAEAIVTAGAAVTGSSSLVIFYCKASFYYDKYRPLFFFFVNRTDPNLTRQMDIS